MLSAEQVTLSCKEPISAPLLAVEPCTKQRAREYGLSSFIARRLKVDFFLHPDIKVKKRNYPA